MVTGTVNQYVRDGETNPTTDANCGVLTSHYVAVSKVSVANAKVGQDDLLMAVPVPRSLPRTVDRNLPSLLTSTDTAGLTSGADGPLKRTEAIPKSEGKVDVRGLV